MNLRPPGVTSDKWDELDVWAQAKVLAYCQIREHEEFRDLAFLAKVQHEA